MRSASLAPPSPRLRRAGCAPAASGTSSSTNAAKVKRLHDIWIQLIVMGPQPFVNGTDERVGIAPRPREPAQEACFDHVLSAVAFSHPIDRAVVDGLHHVALGL